MKNDRYEPPLSIVVTARNDDHGGNQLQRLQLHVNGILSQSKRFGLDIEYILVEWNPPPDRPSLDKALTWPSDPGSCHVRIIEVPADIHGRLMYSESLPLFQMLGKNVGIRRASGKFVLSTNIDIMFSDEMICYLASGRLKRNSYYRTNRYDIPQNIPEFTSMDNVREYCEENIMRISDREGVRNLHDGSFFRIFQPMDWRLQLKELKQDLGLTEITNPSLLFTNACGDFTLMARERWFELYGYPELEMYSFHLDSLFLHAANHNGLKEKTLKDPLRIYHIDHGTGSGWSPEGQDKLNHRLKKKGIYKISDQQLEEWTLQMRRERRPIIFSNNNWGFASEDLKETVVYGGIRTASDKRQEISAFGSGLSEERAPENRGYLIYDPKSRMSANPLVSVVVPSLNRAKYLIPTIDSILNQDYLNIECIVVDGGSTDESIEILKGYGDRIKWISESDNGHADAINKGWHMSEGEILAWLNADDLWNVPGTVSQVIEYFKMHPEVSLVYGECGRIDDGGTQTGMSYIHEWDLQHAVENCDHCIPQPAAFIQRNILEKVGWLDTDFKQKKDHELWLRIGMAGMIRKIPATLAYARKIKGLSDDGKTMARSCVQVCRKFYSSPHVMSPIRRRKRRALSNSYLKGIEYAFSGGRHWIIVFSYALSAVFVYPANSFRVMQCLRRVLAEGAEEGIRDNRMLSRIIWKMIHLSFTALQTFGPSGVLPELLSKIRWCLNSNLPARTPNLLGDRDIEWSWVVSQMPEGPGKALDIGPGGSHLSLLCAQKGYSVTAVDLQPINFPYQHSGVRFVQGDILNVPLPMEHFDLVVNCSTVEHIGMAGRYGVQKNLDNGDLDTMSHLRELMKLGGEMLLTVPVGKDAVCTPLCRIYGNFRLPLLLEGYTVEKEAYWVKDEKNRWLLSDKETALYFDAICTSWNPLRNVYALGCFVLKRE
jgi:glycosyltransferase involved in cell wall biosynthesis